MEKTISEGGIRRILTPDGKMFVEGAKWKLIPSDLYHRFLSLNWPCFFLVYSGAFLSINVVFAVAYAVLPGNQFDGMRPESGVAWVLECFFFSVQTFATIGYGHVAPVGIFANLLVTLEAFLGLSSAAIMTGLVFARFARPQARVLFSKNALISSDDGRPCLVFRLANERLNQVVDAHINVAIVLTQTRADGTEFRRLFDMALRRDRSPVFVNTWSVFHYIDDKSVFAGHTPETLMKLRPQIIVSFTGIDETLSQTVHSRNLYLSDSILWNRRFVDILQFRADGHTVLNLKHFHDTLPL